MASTDIVVAMGSNAEYRASDRGTDQRRDESQAYDDIPEYYDYYYSRVVVDLVRVIAEQQHDQYAQDVEMTIDPIIGSVNLSSFRRYTSRSMPHITGVTIPSRISQASG